MAGCLSDPCRRLVLPWPTPVSRCMTLWFQVRLHCIAAIVYLSLNSSLKVRCTRNLSITRTTKLKGSTPRHYVIPRISLNTCLQCRGWRLRASIRASKNIVTLLLKAQVSTVPRSSLWISSSLLSIGMRRDSNVCTCLYFALPLFFSWTSLYFAWNVSTGLPGIVSDSSSKELLW